MPHRDQTRAAVRDADKYEAALEEALNDLLKVRVHARAMREKVFSLEQEIREARSLVYALAKKASPDAAHRILSALDEQPHAVKLDRTAGREEYGKLIDVLYCDPGREWTINEMQNALASLGYDVSNKTLGTTLARLARKGGLIQVARGKYRVPEYGVVVETSDELESAVDLTRSCED